MKKTISFFIILLTVSFSTYSQDKFACFENDNNNTLQISICFDQNGKAKYVKYNGQNETIPLFFKKTERTENAPGGHPRYWISEIYVEKYRGVVTGTYTFTNAGTHGLDVTFKRKKDNKEFYFSIIEGLQDPNDGTYRSDPCW